MSYDTTKVDKTGTTYDPLDTQHIWAEDWNAFVAAFKTHASRHTNGSTDPLKLDDLAIPDDNTDLDVSIARHGLCPKLPNNTTTFLRGDGTWATPASAAGGDVVGPASATDNAVVRFDSTTGKLIQNSNVTVSDNGVVNIPSGQQYRINGSQHTHAQSEVTDLVTDLAGKAAVTHATAHENGGADEISVAGLSGLLADAQTPLAHNQAATTITSGTLDGDRLPAMSTTKRGGVPATGTPSNKVLRDDGTWVVNGTFGGTVGTTDNAIPRANGTGGDTLQGSVVTISDAGTINIPTGQTYQINGTALAVANITGAAPLASPTFTGTPSLPTGTTGVTQAADDTSTKLATTAFVTSTQKGTASPQMDGSATAGTSEKWTPIDHVHPTDTSRAPTANPTFTGVVTAPTISLTGGQIAFPASASASADANTLDDYEEGTWTPALAFGGTEISTSGGTYGSQLGYYTKIGRVVHASFYMQLTAKGSATGTATITGYPFTALTGSNRFNTPSSMRVSNLTFSIFPQGLITLNTTVLGLSEAPSGSTATNITNSDFADNTVLYISLVYGGS